MLQKYSAESAGQPALEITPSAGFPPREVRVETGSHTSGPHTLLFWDRGSPPGAACRGRDGTVPSSSCWRAVGPRSRTALPPPPPTLSFTRSSAPSPSGTRHCFNPRGAARPRTPDPRGSVLLLPCCDTMRTSVLLRYDGERLVAGLCCEDARGQCRQGQRPTDHPNWALVTHFRIARRPSLTDQWVPLSSLQPADL